MAEYEDLVDFDHLALYDSQIKQVIAESQGTQDAVQSITAGGTEVPKVNGVVALGSAATASSETTVTDGSNLPTGSAVRSYVTGLGYQTASDVSTAISNSGAVMGVTVGSSAVPETGGVVALGSAAGASTESTLTNGSNLPTGSAVRSYVTGLGYQTASDVDTAIANSALSMYKIAGSKAASEITSALLVAANLGNVYNLSTALTIDASNKGLFVENVEAYYPPGTNLVVINVGTSSAPSYKFDVLSGVVDLSGYLESTDVTIVTNAQINSLFE